MKIRTIFLIAITLSFLPPLLIGYWAKDRAIDDGLSYVAMQNSLLAQNLGFQLDSYTDDVTILLDAVSQKQSAGEGEASLRRAMGLLQVLSVARIDRDTGKILALHRRHDASTGTAFDRNKIKELSRNAFQAATNFSAVEPGRNGENIIYALKRYGNIFTLAQIETHAFSALAKSATPGKALPPIILDRYGNIVSGKTEKPKLSDQLLREISPDAPAPKDIRANGGSVLEVAGEDYLTTSHPVPGSGWRVVILEPISAIALHTAKSQFGFIAALVAGLAFALVVAMVLARFLVKPLEAMSNQFRADARRSVLSTAEPVPAPFRISELSQVQRNYNRLVDEVSSSQSKVRHLAYIDTLTGLANRESFNTSLEQALEKARFGTQSGALVTIDLDRFKQVNDVHGHEAGNRLLIAVARSMQEAVELWTAEQASAQSGETLIARIGGDEFAVLLCGWGRKDDAEQLMKRIGSAVESATSEDDHFATVGASLGGARFPIDGTDCETILKRADMAMYKAKNTGRGRYVLFDSSHGILTPGELRHEVSQAIKNSELRLLYQPQLCAKSRNIVGIEALVRWQHPERGLQTPDSWVPEIANSQIIVELGEWVFRQAMADLAEIHKTGRNISAAVNIGSRHFLATGFTDMIRAISESHDIAADRVDIEVTEDAVFQSSVHAEAVLTELRDGGFRVAIDDFGKGFSNMSRLADLPVDFLKIDRSIVDGARKNPRTRTILASMISMAGDLGCRTTAEGIETVRQADFTTFMGSDVLQGYYFAQPMSKEDLLIWMDAWEAGTIGSLNKKLLAEVA